MFKKPTEDMEDFFFFKKTLGKFIELKTTKSEMKNTLDEINGRLDIAEGRIVNLKA